MTSVIFVFAFRYYMNLIQNPRTLLPKFYGLYCYSSLNKNIRLVIMNNLLPSSVKMHEKYDLKGSTFKRKASKAEREKKAPTLKVGIGKIRYRRFRELAISAITIAMIL